MRVRKAYSWDLFRKAWIDGMKHLHWFSQDNMFDYNRQEELENLRKDFGNPDTSLCLVAFPRGKGDEKALGALRVRFGSWRGSSTAIFRGWEPAVSPERRHKGVSEVLIKKALSLLKMSMERAVLNFKYPYESIDAEKQIKLYASLGFERVSPVGVTMITELYQSSTIHETNVETIRWEQFSLEELANFILKAYATTPTDKSIHSWDPLVSDREKITSWLRLAREGKDRFSHLPECCKIALVDGEPAGFIGALIPPKKSEYRPSFGILGPLGVFPEFRRQGIAISLISTVHEILKRRGCRYCLVGTPETNQKAIQLYIKAGYKPILKQIELCKNLS